MEEQLVLINIGITALALSFLFLYFKKYQELIDLKNKLHTLEETEEHDIEAQKVKDDFLAMVVHELRSPLAVIKGSSDLLIKETKSLTSAQITDLLKQVRSSSGDLLNLVNDMLDVSKMEAGRFEIYPKDTNINNILEDETRRYTMLAKEKEVEIKLHLDPLVSNLRFDPDKIRQVLNNLLSNAVKFTPAGGYVEIRAEKSVGKVRISVADTGIGIPDEVKSKLFNKFVQGRSIAGSEEKGTGLGLVIAKGIVEAHGGIIWMEDNKPKGTKFVFTLPLS